MKLEQSRFRLEMLSFKVHNCPMRAARATTARAWIMAVTWTLIATIKPRRKQHTT